MKPQQIAAFRRVARRAVIGAETLPVADRAQLFEDVSLILPADEARVAKDLAFHLRESMQMQTDFLAVLK